MSARYPKAGRQTNEKGTGELPRAGTVKKFLTVRQEGVRQVNRELVHYNLDAIISLGYRVNSLRSGGPPSGETLSVSTIRAR